MHKQEFRVATFAILTAFFISTGFPLAGTRIASHFFSDFNIAWLYIHHSVQMGLALLCIFLINQLISRKFSWGLNLRNAPFSLKISLRFALGWLLVSLVFNLLFSFPSHINYKLSFINILSDLFFDLIFTGISEEILFRGLIMGLLLTCIKGKMKIRHLEISYAAIITTILFSLAHIGIDYQHFRITDFSGIQMAFCVGLGLFYAVLREKSGSLLGPVVAHGASDGIITIIQLFQL